MKLDTYPLGYKWAECLVKDRAFHVRTKLACSSYKLPSFGLITILVFCHDVVELAIHGA